MTRLAGLIDVTAKAVSDYEKGEYPPSDELWPALRKLRDFRSASSQASISMSLRPTRQVFAPCRG